MSVPVAGAEVDVTLVILDDDGTPFLAVTPPLDPGEARAHRPDGGGDEADVHT